MIYVVIATTKERRARLDECITAIRESTIPHSIVIYENLDGGCVLATKKAIEGLDAEIFLLNDDMIIEPDCLTKLKEAYDKNYPNKDGVCQPYMDSRRCPSAGSPYCHTSTIRPFLEHYVHCGWDTEFGQVMQMKNKYTVVPEANLEHRRVPMSTKNKPLYENIELDETYKMRNASRERDQKLFLERKNGGFKDRFK
jgi:hypothetical protein